MDSGNSQNSGSGSPYTGGTQNVPETQNPPSDQNPYFNQMSGFNQFASPNQFPGNYPFNAGLPYFTGYQYTNLPQFTGNAYVGAGRPVTPQAFHWSIGRGIDPNYGDAVYRPEMVTSTPGSHGSTTVPVTDPTFSTDEYDVAEMHPSPPKDTGKGKGKGKGKEKVAEPTAPQTKGRRPRTKYRDDETVALARVWVDIGEDAAVGNNQRRIGFWTRIANRYNSPGVKPDWAPTHKPAELRKHWERVMFEMAKFHGIYENNLRTLGSGMSYDDARNLSLAQFTGSVNSSGFNHWPAYMVVKDKEKFQTGIEAALATGSRRTRLVASQSLSSGGTAPTDLTESVSVSQPTQRRPVGNKATKAAGKGKGKTQQSASQATDVEADSEVKVAAYVTLHKFYKLYQNEGDARMKTEIWKTIMKMKKQFGMDSDDDDA